MTGLFYVRDPGKQIIYAVFGTRTEDGPMGMTQFLLYDDGRWFWDNVWNYEPYDMKE
jgi:hypothetical protein